MSFNPFKEKGMPIEKQIRRGRLALDPASRQTPLIREI